MTEESTVTEQEPDTGDLVGTDGDPAEVDPVPEDVTPDHPDHVDPDPDATPVAELDDFEEVG